MLKPTLGPWRVVETAKDGYFVVDGLGQNLLFGVPAAEANARLMAVAPELLDACRRLLKFNEELCADVNVSTHYPSADVARAAIAKAEGR